MPDDIIDTLRERARWAWAAARREITPLMLLAAVLIGVWGFLELADAVSEGDLESFDSAVLTAVRLPDALDTPVGPIWLKQVARDVTALGGWFLGLCVTAFVVGYLLLTRERWLALYVGVSVAGGTGLSQVLKAVFDRARPDVVPHLVEVSTASFPSGHAMGSSVVWLTIGALMARSQTRKRVKSYLLATATVIVIAVGLTRIYLGVHWPSDVLSGWSIGTAWALGCWLLVRMIERRRRGESKVPDQAPSSGVSSESGEVTSESARMPPEPSELPSAMPSESSEAPSESSDGSASSNAGTAGARSRSLKA